MNRLYAAAVKGDPQVILLETWPLFAGPDGEAKIEEFPDLLHPNKAGYVKWAAAVYPILATHDFVDTHDDHFTPEPGFESLFNGQDLTGWGYVPTLPEDIQTAKHWHEQDPQAPDWPIVTQTVRFDGLTNSPDGRYVAKHGRLIVTTSPDFRKIQKISTMRKFPSDFILKLEFRAAADADSGIFIREPQLQCRDYLIAGPYNQLQHYKPQDWNEIVIAVHGRKALCTCNGEVMESAFDVPATGPIGLEGDRGAFEFRNCLEKTGWFASQTKICDYVERTRGHVPAPIRQYVILIYSRCLAIGHAPCSCLGQRLTSATDLLAQQIHKLRACLICWCRQ
jgi:hypothetical protein